MSQGKLKTSKLKHQIVQTKKCFFLLQTFIKIITFQILYIQFFVFENYAFVNYFCHLESMRRLVVVPLSPQQVSMHLVHAQSLYLHAHSR